MEQHDGIAYELVQALDAPVPQMVEQLLDVLRFFAMLLPVLEQDIEVLKILLDYVPVRTAVRVTQLAEQLVEVPTIVSCSSLQRAMEQHDDTPVPRRGGRNAGLQGFLLGQCSVSLERISERIKIFAQDRVHNLLRMLQLVIKKA